MESSLVELAVGLPSHRICNEHAVIKHLVIRDERINLESVQTFCSSAEDLMEVRLHCSG